MTATQLSNDIDVIRGRQSKNTNYVLLMTSLGVVGAGIVIGLTGFAMRAGMDLAWTVEVGWIVADGAPVALAVIAAGAIALLAHSWHLYGALPTAGERRAEFTGDLVWCGSVTAGLGVIASVVAGTALWMSMVVDLEVEPGVRAVGYAALILVVTSLTADVPDVLTSLNAAYRRRRLVRLRATLIFGRTGGPAPWTIPVTFIVGPLVGALILGVVPALATGDIGALSLRGWRLLLLVLVLGELLVFLMAYVFGSNRAQTPRAVWVVFMPMVIVLAGSFLLTSTAFAIGTGPAAAKTSISLAFGLIGLHGLAVLVPIRPIGPRLGPRFVANSVIRKDLRRVVARIRADLTETTDGGDHRG